MNCPLCGGKVTYEGLNNIECSTKGCENYKAQALKFDSISFDETLIDWDWFVPFCGWLSMKTGKNVVPIYCDPRDTFCGIVDGWGFEIAAVRNRSEVPERLRDCVELVPWLKGIF